MTSTVGTEIFEKFFEFYALCNLLGKRLESCRVGKYFDGLVSIFQSRHKPEPKSAEKPPEPKPAKPSPKKQQNTRPRPVSPRPAKPAARPVPAPKVDVPEHRNRTRFCAGAGIGFAFNGAAVAMGYLKKRFRSDRRVRKRYR